ncbi:putative membrane protein YwzB [Chryseobacterium koreense]|nr:putative membrane protein YwzB [Chryseobacterium koreense]
MKTRYLKKKKIQQNHHFFIFVNLCLQNLENDFVGSYLMMIRKLLFNSPS